MKQLIWSSPAGHDMDLINDYLRSFGESVAEKALDQIEAAARFLWSYPSAGPSLTNVAVRKWLIRGTDYVLVYRLTDDAVEIVRVHHNRENWRAD